jgi:FixJ family two-component response regulator
MTGVQFGRRLPAYHNRPPLILISGSSPQALDDAAASLRPVKALRKPFDVSQLLSSLEAALRETAPG